MKTNLLKSFQSLRKYCEAEKFKGWDPYDGLNSKVFQALPFFKKSAICRLIMIQGFKRSPLNLRRIMLVPKGYNAKGIGLFLQGYCNLYNAVKGNPSLEKVLGSTEELKRQINDLAELLISLHSKGYSGACWGYNFDWQSKAFFLPQYTPTVVATSFIVEALFAAYEITKNDKYRDIAISSGDFILKDLNRINKTRGFMFSYSPLDNRAVYNASLLGTKTLALIYKYTQQDIYKIAAKASAKAVCDQQNADGSFPHSDQIGNKWRDSFHTGFKLESLSIYQRLCNDYTFEANINKGYEFWLKHYFIPEKGIALYYDNSSETDLIDLHCVAQFFPTLYKAGKLSSQNRLAQNLINWTINNMQSKKGYFYFQKKGNHRNKIAYMRWPNAWMFYGFSFQILNNASTNE